MTLTYSDAELVAAVAAGQVQAFTALVERHHRMVCAIAFARLGDRQLSEDAAQETFLALWRGASTIEHSERVGAWLASTARRRAIDIARKYDRVQSEPTAPDTPADAPRADELLSDAQLGKHVWAELTRLPEKYREPLVLYYREEQSVSAVATGLGLSIAAAKQRLARGRQQLRASLAPLVAGHLRKTAPTGAFLVALAARASAEAGVAQAMMTQSSAHTAGNAASATLRATAPVRSIQRLGLVTLVTFVGGLLWLLLSTSPAGANGNRAGSAANNTPPADVKSAPAGQRPAKASKKVQPRSASDSTARAATARLEVLVLDTDEHPVPRAEVIVKGVTSSGKPWRKAITTGADGSFAREGLPLGKATLLARRRSGGAASTPYQLPLTEQTELVVLTLRPAVDVDVQLLDRATARPVAGATVSVDTGHRTTSDKHGLARLRGVPEGMTGLQVDAPGYALWRGTQMYPPGQGVVSRRVLLGKGVPLAGRVIDGAAHPVANATVAATLTSVRVGRVFTAQTDANGSWSFRSVEPGIYEVFAGTETAEGERVISVGTGGQTDIVVGIAPAPVDPTPTGDQTISGRVLDDLGQPVARALVGVAAGVSGYRLLADEEGNFHTSRAPAGSVRLWATAPDELGAYRYLRIGSDVTATSPTDKVTLTIARAGTVTGQLRFSNGRAPHEAYVAIATDEGATEYTAEPIAIKDGTIDLPGIPLGRYVINLHGPGFGRQMAQVVVEPGQTTELGTIKVTAGRTLHGRVVATDGRPVRAAWVLAGKSENVVEFALRLTTFGVGTASFWKTGIRWAATDADGRFTMAGIDDEHQLLIAVTTDDQRSMPVAASSTPLELRIQQTGSITGSLTRRSTPVVARLELRSNMRSYYGASTEDGRFEFRAAVPGSYKLHQGTEMLTNLPKELAKVEVVSGKLTELSVTLADEATKLTVTIADTTQAGGLVSLNRVDSSDDTDTEVFRLVLPGQSSIVFDGLPLGSYKACVTTITETHVCGDVVELHAGANTVELAIP